MSEWVDQGDVPRAGRKLVLPLLVLMGLCLIGFGAVALAAILAWWIWFPGRAEPPERRISRALEDLSNGELDQGSLAELEIGRAHV